MLKHSNRDAFYAYRSGYGHVHVNTHSLSDGRCATILNKSHTCSKVAFQFYGDYPIEVYNLPVDVYSHRCSPSGRENQNFRV